MARLRSLLAPASFLGISIVVPSLATADGGGSPANPGEPIPYGVVIPVDTSRSSDSEAPAHGSFGYLLGIAGEFGGDNIATVYFTDNSSQNVDTGGGVTVFGGAHYRTTSNWDFRGTVGYKYVTTKADNANIYVDRLVLEAAADYYFPAKWFAGAGVLRHSLIKFHSDGLGPNLGFKDANGWVIEAGWSFVGLTYTFMRYQDDSGIKYKANDIGVMFIWRI